MPHTKASATYQRSYFTKPDITTILKGLNQNIKAEKLKGVLGDAVPLERLRALLRYRKIDPDKSIIIDRFGKSVLLDKFEERGILNAVKALITQTDKKLLRETVKRDTTIAEAWKRVIESRKGIAKLEKDILYYKTRMKVDPSNAISYHKIISADSKRLKLLQGAESRRVIEWSNYTSLKPSVNTITLKAEKERYEAIIKGLEFQKR